MKTPETTAQTPNPAAAAQDTATPAPKVPVWVEQKGYRGETERVDKTLHSHEFTCPECGGTRWVAPGDLFQVDACKPCIGKRRKDKRNEKAKAKRKAKALAKARALLEAEGEKVYAEAHEAA